MLASMKAKAKEVGDNVSARVEQGKAGKALLAQEGPAGGPVIEAKLIGKKTAIDALTFNHNVVAKVLPQNIAWLQAACKNLQAAITEGKHACSLEEVQEMEGLFNQYTERTIMLQNCLEMMQQNMPIAPNVTPVEIDAITILQAKGKYPVTGTIPK